MLASLDEAESCKVVVAIAFQVLSCVANMQYHVSYSIVISVIS